ncbi:MAG: hypothetical protein QOJ34_3207 [Pseudonocardiales bacterium]|nr:hypothetical protein [Pseudonocardiales bacterium]
MSRPLLDQAPGRDPGPGLAGVEANARLTATTGMLLALLLLTEGWTLLDVRGYITLHTALGLILIGPVVLKCLTTIYRFGRYYTGAPAYVRKGPPHIILRVIGPLVVISTIAVIATGIALLVDHGQSGTWLTLHQASFIAWISVTGIHFLGHLQGAVVDTGRELRRATRDPAQRGKAVRWVAVAAALLVGVGLAAAFTPAASSWQLQHDHRGTIQGR